MTPKRWSQGATDQVLSRCIMVNTEITDELFGMVLDSFVWNVCERRMNFRTEDYCRITRKFLNSDEFPYQFVHIIYTMQKYKYSWKRKICVYSYGIVKNIVRSYITYHTGLGCVPKILCAVCNKLTLYKSIRCCPKFPHGTNIKPPHIAILQYVISQPNPEMASLQSHLCGSCTCHIL
jgi:hypothetical protein